MPTFRTLFSGGELFGIGARQAGYVHVDGYEIAPSIAAVARLNGFDVRLGRRDADGARVLVLLDRADHEDTTEEAMTCPTCNAPLDRGQCDRPQGSGQCDRPQCRAAAWRRIEAEYRMLADMAQRSAEAYEAESGREPQ
jgi:hypothetical protein